VESDGQTDTINGSTLHRSYKMFYALFTSFYHLCGGCSVKPLQPNQTF